MFLVYLWSVAFVFAVWLAMAFDVPFKPWCGIFAAVWLVGVVVILSVALTA